MYVSWFEQKCHTMEQYRKFDSMNALNNFSLLSLDRNLDTRVMALICLDARVHIVEICLWKVNLLSIKMPSSWTHSLGAKSWPWTFMITGSLQWPAFIMIAWNFDGLALMWRSLEDVHLWAVFCQVSISLWVKHQCMKQIEKLMVCYKTFQQQEDTLYFVLGDQKCIRKYHLTGDWVWWVYLNKLKAHVNCNFHM